MSFKSMRLAIAALLQALALSGCGVVVLINAANEQDKFAKTFSPPDDKALIYVYLADRSSNMSNRVVIDGRIAGTIRPAFFSMSNVMPGPHRVGLAHMETDSILLEAEEGKTYFLGADVSCAGGAAHARLRLVDESTGRRQVAASDLANITLFGNPLFNDDGPAGQCPLSIGEL